MTDSMHSDHSNHPFGSAEPARDAELGALLRRVTGDVPVASVDWDELAARIARALPVSASAPWWSYAARWERRMLPLALAAGLVGALALWNSDDVASLLVAQSPDMVSEMVTGVAAEDAATTFARAVTSDFGLGDTVAE